MSARVKYPVTQKPGVREEWLLVTALTPWQRLVLWCARRLLATPTKTDNRVSARELDAALDHPASRALMDACGWGWRVPPAEAMKLREAIELNLLGMRAMREEVDCA
jgi:hypothetical protein